MSLGVFGFKLKRYKLLMTILFTLTLGEMILILIEGYYVFSFEGKACLGGFEKNFDILVTFLS